MKRPTPLLALAIVLWVHCMSASNLAIFNGLLQNDFNGGGNSITNLNKLSITNLGTIGGLIETNGVTNLDATASTLSIFDANKKHASLANAAGVTTNDGNGNIGYSQVLNGLTLNNFRASPSVSTNQTFLTFSNSALTGATLTNDLANAVNSSQNVIWDFFGTSSTNIPQIEATGPLGLYGEMYWNTTHDNPAGRPQDVEFAITSINRIAAVCDITGIGDDPAFQMGGVGVPSRFFINYVTNTVTQIGSSPSEGFLLRSAYRTNGTTFIVAPELVSSTVSNVAGKGWDSHFYINHESGTWGNEVGTPDVNLGIVGIDLEMNTNSTGLYTGITFNGRTNGAIRSSIALTGTQILLSSNVVAKNYTSDQWLAPNYFAAGGGSVGAPNFVVNGDNVQSGISDANLNFQIADGNGGAAHAYFLSGGNWGGNVMPKGSLAVNGGNGAVVTNASDAIEGYGQIWARDGLGSSGTNATVSVGSTGITNTLSVIYRVIGFTGTSVVQTNKINGLGFSRGTITTPTDINLQSGEFLKGSSCAAQGVQDL